MGEHPGVCSLTLLVYTAEPHTPSHDALNLLASWASTLDREAIASSTDHA